MFLRKYLLLMDVVPRDSYKKNSDAKGVNLEGFLRIGSENCLSTAEMFDCLQFRIKGEM